MSFFRDYVEGKYPSYPDGLFLADLVACIQPRLVPGCTVFLSTQLFDKFGPPLLTALDPYHAPEVIADSLISIDEGWKVSCPPEPGFEEFVEHLRKAGLSCTPEDFRLIKLFETYSNWKQR